VGPPAAGHLSMDCRRGRRWSVRAAYVVTVSVAVAAAAVASAAATDGETGSVAEASGAAAVMQSGLAFPAGERMPEGRWTSVCSLACILPGVNSKQSVMDSQFVVGADVCIAHVDDAAATMGPGNATLHSDVALTLTVRAMASEQNRGSNRRPDPVVTYETHAAQETTQPHCPTGSRLMHGRTWWPTHPDLLPIAKDTVAEKHRQLVADEAMVFAALTMGRNVLHGSVHRQVGVYDLVAASVQRLGICADERCNAVIAIDTTRPSAPNTRCRNDSATDVSGGTSRGSGSAGPECSTTNVPIITHMGPDGVERPVHIASFDLLTLGRGMLASPSWFKRAATPFHLGGKLTMQGPSLSVPIESNTGLLSIQDGVESVEWDLNGTTLGGSLTTDSDSLPVSSRSTPFLAHVATVFCAGKLRSFLASSSACDGVRPWGRVHRPSPSVEIEGNIMDAGAWTGVGKVDWTVTPTRSTTTATGDARTTDPALTYVRPPWTTEELPLNTAEALRGFEGPSTQVTPLELVGRPYREVNPSSTVEGRLAASLFQRQLVLPSLVSDAHSSAGELDFDAAVIAASTAAIGRERAREFDRLSHAYDRRVFQEEHPASPVSAADLILATIVVVPELGALLALLLTTGRWGRSALMGFGTIIVLGAVSVAGVIALASQEAAGAAWRARSSRTATHAIFPAGYPVNQYGEHILTGTLVVIDKSFMLLAPTVYKPTWVLWVAAAVCGTYVATAAAMTGHVLIAAQRRWRVRLADVEAPPSEEARETSRRARRWWRPRPRGVDESSASETDSTDGIGTAAARAWRSSEVGAAFSGATVPTWPASAGGFSYPSW